MMIYHPRQVANFVFPSRENYKLANRKSPFNLNQDIEEEVKNILLENISSSKLDSKSFDPLLVYGLLAGSLSGCFSPDEPRTFAGCRKNQQTWDDKSGHCFELGMLLHQLASYVYDDFSKREEIPTLYPRIFLAKNLKGFELEDSTSDYGLHLTTLFPRSLKDDYPMLTDLVSGRTCFVYDGLYIDGQQYSNLETIAIHWIASAEDKGLERGNVGEALCELDLAKRIDPNNYHANVIEAQVHENAGNISAAISAYQDAMALAPDSFDVHAEFTEFLYRVDQNVGVIKREIEKAIPKYTKDYQLVDKCQHLCDVIGDSSLKTMLRSKKKALVRKYPHLRSWIKNKGINSKLTFAGFSA